METAVKATDFASAPINKSLSPDDKIRFLRDMLRIRRFEQTALNWYQNKQTMGGFLHLYIGQEAVAVGDRFLAR
jgi:pyruvate dehydrogenase E1 component alpha subunit